MSSRSEVLNPQLADLVRQVEAIVQDARDLTSGLSHSQFNWRPEAGRWSIAECLGHLNISEERFLDGIEPAVREARAKGVTGQGPFRYGLLTSWFARSLEPPPKFKVKAGKTFIAPSDQTLERVMADFEALHERVAAQMAASEGLHLGRVKAVSLVSQRVKLCLGVTFRILTAHDRRHLYQARQVRNHAAFPR